MISGQREVSRFSHLSELLLLLFPSAPRPRSQHRRFDPAQIPIFHGVIRAKERGPDYRGHGHLARSRFSSVSPVASLTERIIGLLLLPTSAHQQHST